MKRRWWGSKARGVLTIFGGGGNWLPFLRYVRTQYCTMPLFTPSVLAIYVSDMNMQSEVPKVPNLLMMILYFTYYGVFLLSFIRFFLSISFFFGTFCFINCSRNYRVLEISYHLYGCSFRVLECIPANPGWAFFLGIFYSIPANKIKFENSGLSCGSVPLLFAWNWYLIQNNKSFN